VTPAPSTLRDDRTQAVEADWAAISSELLELGCALTPQLITTGEAAELVRLYDHHHAFRSTVHMDRHRFGKGEYRYFARPLPSLVETLRQMLYPHLLPIARDWSVKLGRPNPWPDTLDEWLDLCHAAGQDKPTQSSCATASATGTPSTATSTGTWFSPSRWSST
jgi:uncharacterized protein